MRMTATSGDAGWSAPARMLYLVAMAIFLVTIAIGIPNALNVFQPDRNQVLTHVHSGTVGWLTLTIVATSFVLFRAADARLAAALAAGVPVYVLAFYSGNLAFRALSGTALLLVILWLLAWVWRSYLGGPRTLPRLGIALAVTTFTYGAIVGTLLQVGFAMGVQLLPGNGVGAHAGAMTFGYLALAGMAALEWRILGTAGLPRAGIVQFGALFAGGLILSAALLGGAEQVGGMLYLVAQLVSVVLFAIRVVPAAVRGAMGSARATRDPGGSPAGRDPGTGPAGRHLGAASLWIVVALVLFMAVVAQFVANPTGQLNTAFLVAGDHAVYIGVITNVAFAVILGLTAVDAARGLVGTLVFWGVNLGLLVFVLGLATTVEPLKVVGAPVMGVSLLVGMGLLAVGLVADRGAPARAEPAAA
jgi:hypothetical protein